MAMSWDKINRYDVRLGVPPLKSLAIIITLRSTSAHCFAICKTYSGLRRQPQRSALPAFSANCANTDSLFEGELFYIQRIFLPVLNYWRSGSLAKLLIVFSPVAPV